MSSPYSKDAQIFTFGVHGTNNTPAEVRGVAAQVSVAVGQTTDGANLFDNGFDWRARVIDGRNHPMPGTAHTMNNGDDREIAAGRLTRHVLQQVDKAIERGTLDRDKPLTINLVGFSHGGNVAIQASDDIARGLRQRGIDSAIHLTTLSTPAYNDSGREDPRTARPLVQAQGVRFAHSHFAVDHDHVVRAAGGSHEYDNGFTRNEFYPRLSRWDGVRNHGATQNAGEENYRDEVSATMRARFNGLAPRTRADAGNGVEVATADVKTASSAADRSVGSDAIALAGGNIQINRQFEQALKGTNGDRDAAAVAVETISRAQSYKPDQDISVVQGKNGLVVSQGQGDAALNLAVPQAKPGDFERVSTQIAAQPQDQPLAQRLDQPERARTM
jgi:hypothetical protein